MSVDRPEAIGRLVRSERRDGDIALITINRPQARNALSFEVWEGLEQALVQAEHDRCRALVLTGEGGYFSAGGDLKSPPSRGKGAFAPVNRLQVAHRVLLHIADCHVPVIAAVEGGASGLGWGLALACDLVVASRGAMFSAPFVTRGVVPDGGVGWLLNRHLGRQRAMDLLLAGATLAADEALKDGLIARLVEPGQAVVEALIAAAALPVGTPNAIEMTKRLVRRADDLNFASYLEQELLSATLCQLGAEAGAGRSAFRSNSAKPA